MEPANAKGPRRHAANSAQTPASRPVCGVGRRAGAGEAPRDAHQRVNTPAGHQKVRGRTPGQPMRAQEQQDGLLTREMRKAKEAAGERRQSRVETYQQRRPESREPRAAGTPAALAGTRQREAKRGPAARLDAGRAAARGRAEHNNAMRADFEDKQRDNERALAALVGQDHGHGERLPQNPQVQPARRLPRPANGGALRDQRETDLAKYTRDNARAAKREAEANKRRVLGSMAEEEASRQRATGNEFSRDESTTDAARFGGVEPKSANPAGSPPSLVSVQDDDLDPRERVRRKREVMREQENERRMSELAAIRQQHREDQRAIERRRQRESSTHEPDSNSATAADHMGGDKAAAMAQAQQAEAAWREKIQRAGGYAPKDGTSLPQLKRGVGYSPSEFEVQEGHRLGGLPEPEPEPDAAAAAAESYTMPSVEVTTEHSLDISNYDTIGIAAEVAEEETTRRGSEFDSMCVYHRCQADNSEIVARAGAE